MAKLTQAQIKEMAKANIMSGLNIDLENTYQTDAYTFAVPTYIDIDGTETEIFVEIKLTAKNWYDTKTTKAFNPVEKENEYKGIIAEREQKEAERIAKKNAKIAKQKAKAENAD